MGAGQTGVPSDKKKRIVTLILLAVLLMSVSVFMMQGDESKNIIITFPNGTEIEVEVADTPEKLLFGLAFQESLPPNGGMIYIFESTGTHQVTTKAYRFPIDMIWVDESHHIVSMMENVTPCPKDPCPWYSSKPEAVRYLIQTEAGFVKRQRLTAGGELKYTLRM
jgi:uncharacterized membrane protein (UPF0127 family)